MAFSKARRLANLMSTASDTVPASKVNTVLADDAVTTAKIADDAITTALIADDAVTSDHLANSINSAITANTAKVTNAITTHTGDVTGGAALTIAVDAVDIPMLSASGSPSSTTFLRGDNEWAAAGGVTTASSTPSPTAEGSLFYNTTLDVLYISNGSAWVPLINSAPSTTGGTVTIAAQSGLSTFSYNLGLNFADDSQTDAQLVYTLESGTLPAGCVLPTAGNTAFTGTATNQATATYTFNIRATDSAGAFSVQAFTQTINVTFIASGGTVSTISGYKVHTFTSSGTFVTNTSKAVEYLVIAGGGGGGQGARGAGAGAGGYRSNVSGQVSGGGASAEGVFNAAQGNNTVTVGGGGSGGPSGSSSANGYNGGNSILSSVTSLGGGGGGTGGSSGPFNGDAGGSGGGAGSYPGGPHSGGAGTTGQGYAGSNMSYPEPWAGGGGGGASAAASGFGGAAGASSNINGTATTRGGGGGGSGNPGSGSGGAGGGGNGTGGWVGSSRGGFGTVNTGGGGAGSPYNQQGGNGGSGIVIVRYAV
jgi:hypothetical protein